MLDGLCLQDQLRAFKSDAGLVGITSACAVVEHYAAVIIGVVAGLIMILTSKLLRRMRIDDPLDSVAVHFACGIW